MVRKQYRDAFIEGIKKAMPITAPQTTSTPREGIPQGPRKRTVPPLKTIPMPNYPRYPKIEPRPPLRKKPKKRMLIA